MRECAPIAAPLPPDAGLPLSNSIYRAKPLLSRQAALSPRKVGRKKLSRQARGRLWPKADIAAIEDKLAPPC
jgi:hypothetical protein